MMNRREWLKTGGTLLAGGLSIASSRMVPGIKSLSMIKEDLKSNRRFVSDRDFMRLFQDESVKTRLMANENPFGPSEKVKAAIHEAVDIGYQYPFPIFDNMIGKFLEFEEMPFEKLLVTAGSTDILTGTALYFTQLGGNIIAGEPSYADMPAFAEELGCDVRWVPLNSEYKLDLKAMEEQIDENTKLIYLVNPNNPTATIIETEELRDFVKRVSKDIPVFVDEAYIEYLDDPDNASMTGLVREGYNVIVARTFSKLYGFAGIRMGYGFAQEEMAKNIMNHCRGFFGISMMGVTGMLAAYRDMEFLNDAKAKTKESKEFLYSVLEREGYEYIPSSTNFVMFPIRMDGERFVEEMFKRDVLVRNWEFDNKHWCRVSVGRMDQMESFDKAFTQIS